MTLAVRTPARHRSGIVPSWGYLGLAAFASALMVACSAPTAAPLAETSDCSPRPILASDLPQATAEELSLTLSTMAFICSSVVVVAETGMVEAAAAEAATRDAPLLITSAANTQAVTAELERLGAGQIVFVGEPSVQALVPAGAEVVAATAPQAAIGDDSPGSIPSLATAEQIWLVRPQDATLATVARSYLDREGGLVLELSSEPTFDRSHTDRNYHTLGPMSPTEAWQARIRFVGPELPGGGLQLFPGRRFLAFYGSPITFRLGLLGEQGPEATMERLRPHLAEYQVPGGDPVLPAFELIATVADSAPGRDNDYSNELAPAELQPWIDVITANDGYAIIDLQSGRTDFLTQAKRYEEYLRLPNVGLAIDPEWRIGADAVHLRQIGTVDAVEVNSVVDWLADLVRSEGLPQKLFVVHQFQAPMVTGRETIRTPPELAVVIHVDGQGPLATKYATWAAMRELPLGADQTLWWGWKNFLDEDAPMATPLEVNAVEPLPVIVTFQ